MLWQLSECRVIVFPILRVLVDIHRALALNVESFLVLLDATVLIHGVPTTKV